MSALHFQRLTKQSKGITEGAVFLYPVAIIYNFLYPSRGGDVYYSKRCSVVENTNSIFVLFLCQHIVIKVI